MLWMKEYCDFFAKTGYAISSQPVGGDQMAWSFNVTSGSRLRYQKTEVFTLGLIQ